MLRWLLLFTTMAFLTACSEEDQSKSGSSGLAPIRGLITVIVRDWEKTLVRKYPSVLEPAEITSLSFEVAGKLGKINLSVGQRVNKRHLIGELDSKLFKVQIENSKAALQEANIILKRSKQNLARKRKLLSRGATTRVSVEDALTDMRTKSARLTQSKKALKSSREDLAKTVLRAPFAGIINTVDAASFTTLGAGAPVVSIYSASAYEMSFSVNFDTVSQLVVGTPAKVRLANNPAVVLAAFVSELGERANTVSSFPVVVTLKDQHPLVRAGMAVEVSFEFKLPVQRGYKIPMSAAIKEGQIEHKLTPGGAVPLGVYVYDPASRSVKRREIMLAGIRENNLLIIKGLKLGEHVASAGVSFLREGMKVKLLPELE